MCRIYVRPGIDNRQDLLRRQVGKRKIVRLAEGQDIAFPDCGFGAEKEALGRRCRRGSVLGLLLLDSAVIVNEDESLLILRIRVAGSALVARAEIALGIVRGQGGFAGSFLLAPVEC